MLIYSCYRKEKNCLKQKKNLFYIKENFNNVKISSVRIIGAMREDK